MTYAIKVTRYDGEVFFTDTAGQEQGERDAQILKQMGHDAELVEV